MNQGASILAVRIRAELNDIAQVVDRAQRFLAKAIEQNDEDYYDGIVLNLHSFYTAVERILEDIAREIDGVVPTGREWHRDLLVQTSAEVSAVRPMVIKRSSRHCLDEYRGLRHVVRNVYTFNLKPSRLQELVLALPDCYNMLVEEFDHLLRLPGSAGRCLNAAILCRNLRFFPYPIHQIQGMILLN